jgi:preprotein translocase subunit YajC
VGYLIIIVVLFAAMWLFLVRPQRRRQLEQAQLQDSLEPGDEILTAGGIRGTVCEIEDELVHVEIAPRTVVRLDRRAVATIVQEPELDAQNEPEPADPPAGSES